MTDDDDRAGARADNGGSGDRRHFEAGGADYARFRPTYPPELVRWLASVAPDDRRALDVGCGTGQLAVLLADHFGEVVATDVSRDQIANAAEHPRVSYRVESAEAPSEGDDSVALVTAGQAAHWFDLDAFCRAATRVAVPGGIVALVCYGVIELGGAAAERVGSFYWDELSGYWPPERRHVETGYADLPFPFDEIDVPEMWIERRWSADELSGYVATWSAVGRMREAGEHETLDGFDADLRRLLGGGAVEVRFPIVGRVGRTADAPGGSPIDPSTSVG